MPCTVDWTEIIPEREWAVHREVLQAMEARGIPCVLGGGLAFTAYSGHERNTKDLDLFLLPSDRERAQQTLTDLGFYDYYAEKPYERSWIYRGCRDGIICDLISGMPNHRMEVDIAWLTRGETVRVRGDCVRLLPVEELIWSKLYVLQRDRCDWPDIVNVLNARAESLDWRYLFDRVGLEDAPLLGAVVALFAWICPSRLDTIPEEIRERLWVGISTGADAETDRERARLLDTRDWFGPTRR